MGKQDDIEQIIRVTDPCKGTIKNCYLDHHLSTSYFYHIRKELS